MAGHKKIHSVYVEAFMYPTEDEKKVLKAIGLFLPKDAKIKKEKIESYYGPEIFKVFFSTTKQAEIKKVLELILKSLSAKDKVGLRKNLRERLDDDGCFFLRFDKQKAFACDAVLAYRGDVIKIAFKIASYPFSIEKIEKTLEDLLA